PVEVTNEDIRNSAAYKEYYAIASGAAPPKTKASVRKTQSSFDTTMPPPKAAGTRLSTSAKGKQPTKSSKAKGLSVLSKVALTVAEQMKLATKKSLQQTHISQASGSDQIQHKDAKKSNEMYYPRFTKVIINFFMTKDPSILRRNKVNWHYVRDDQMFTTIKLVSRHQNTQQFGAILPVEVTNEDIRNSAAYKEYYAIA
nr:hypothetical protein [Tanacetum cinerariifolium]